jgi:hypothetical protein
VHILRRSVLQWLLGAAVVAPAEEVEEEVRG